MVVTAAVVLIAAWTVSAQATPEPFAPAEQPSAWDVERQAEPRIVSSSWLAAAMKEPDREISVVDLSNIQRFELEHIPGAVHGWWQDGMDPDAGAYGERYASSPDSQERADWFASLGIQPGSTVVVYDDRGNTSAARLVWLLADSGHEDAVILDGGLRAWKGAGNETETGASAEPAPAPAITGRDRLPVVTTEGMADLVAQPDEDVVIMDVRDRSERSDTMVGVLPIGEIPGSVWVPQDSWYREGSDMLLPPEDLRADFANAGIEPDDTVVIYGRFGTDTGLAWAILTALGYEDVRIYDAGWTTWAGEDALPIDPLSTPVA